MSSRVNGDFAYEREAVEEVVWQVEIRPRGDLNEVRNESYVCGMRLAGRQDRPDVAGAGGQKGSCIRPQVNCSCPEVLEGHSTGLAQVVEGECGLSLIHI